MIMLKKSLRNSFNQKNSQESTSSLYLEFNDQTLQINIMLSVCILGVHLTHDGESCARVLRMNFLLFLIFISNICLYDDCLSVIYSQFEVFGCMMNSLSMNKLTPPLLLHPEM